MIKIIRVFHCADINHDSVVGTLLQLGKESVGDGWQKIHGTGEFYDLEGESCYVIYSSSEEESISDVCKVAGIEVEEDL